MSGLGNKEIMAKNISYYMDIKGKSRNELCDDLGFKYSTFSEWITAKKYPRIDKIEMMATYFGIQKSDLIEEKVSTNENKWLKENTIPYTPGKRIPIVGTIKAGYDGIALECIDGFDYADVSNPEEYIFLRIKGDSMEPKISDGDLALIKKQSDVDSGDLAAVIVNGFEGTLKRVIKQGQSIVLQAFNNAYAPQIIAGEDLNDFMIVGKVIETKRKW